MPKPTKPKKPRTKAEWAACRAKLSCRAGREAIDEPCNPHGMKLAVLSLLHAVEDLVVLIEEIHKSKPKP
jgi:hypothetical protein